MRSTVKSGQLALEWTDRIRWDELPAGARAELQGLLRELLQDGAHDEDRVEGASDE
jgi:hypothetical protein